jgi:hypothetical protein
MEKQNYLSDKSPELNDMIKTIKAIQKRMKDDDVKKLAYINVYDKLGKEFDDFFNRYTSIFIKVIKGEDMKTLAAILYYKDQINQGKLTEKELADRLATKYMPEDVKKKSDMNLKKMSEQENQND